MPGEYQVVLDVDGVASKQPLMVKIDPRVEISPADLATTLAFSHDIAVELERDWQAHGEVEAVYRQLVERGTDSAQTPAVALKTAIDAFGKKLEPLRTDHGHEAPALATIGDQLTSLATDVEGADRLPTEAQKALLAECRSRLDQTIALWSGLRGQDLVALNMQIASAGRRPIKVPTAEQITLGGDAESKDLP